ncbi:prolyl oligopeptidase family serine peptidase [Balneolales bacterium ANBcel1]|nr:prolyl oligopeptidase family serine peptidase [Balneolales bacterium ANBcel1]
MSTVRLFQQPRFFLLTLFIIGLMAPAVTVPSAFAGGSHWSPEDIVSQERAGQFAFSPDGTIIAWVKTRNSSEKDRNVTDLYLTRLDRTAGNSPSGGRSAGASSEDEASFLTIRLTRSEESDRNPFFSRDGNLLYFLSSRDNGNKLWAMNLHGGEPYEVHEFDEGIRSVQQLEDGTITFLSDEGDLLIETERKDREDNTQVIEDTVTFKPVRLFSFDPDSRQVRRLTDNLFPISTYAVSDDGRFAVTGHTRSPHYGADAHPPPSYFFWDLETGKRIRILQGMQTPGNFSFTDDNRGVYFSAVTSSDPQWSGAGISELYYMEIPEDEPLARIMEAHATNARAEAESASSKPHPARIGQANNREAEVSGNADTADNRQAGKGRTTDAGAGSKPGSDEPNGGGNVDRFGFLPPGEVPDGPLSVVKVPLDWDWALGSGYHVLGNDVLASLADGPTRKLAHYERRGNGEWRKREVDAGKHNGRVAIAAIAEDHSNMVFVHSTASTMPQYRIGELDVRRRSAQLSEGKELFQLNSGLRDKHIAKTEIFRWTGAEGTEVNGILYYPENYDPERRYPLTVAIRGGPAAVTLDWWNMSWAYFPHILSQKESFVLMPNYHGSSSHGLEFVESIKGRYYELELIDIVNGIQTLDEQGKIDTDSLGVMGWSNGSILSIALSIEYPEMFRVVGAGAGNVNWISDYGTCMFGVRFDQSYIGGAPWDSTGALFYNTAYIEKSPIFRMDQVRAPTIIFFGSEDRAVPRDQGWEHYRALQQIGRAPVRFLWFPGQPHSLQKLTHQTRKLKEEIAWFDRYLFGTYEEPNRAFKDDSPLAELLKRDSLASHGGYYGVRNSDKLIPEVVPIGSAQNGNSGFPEGSAIGRFQVTNKQFQAFDPEHEFHPLMGNHPVRYVTVDQARAYADWLSGHTGQTWRLPNADEAEILHRAAHRAGARQNTLNRLAGYDITVDEVQLLRSKTDLLPPDRLITQAGSFGPVTVGEAEIYDLGGNVTEWVDTGAKGTGTAKTGDNSRGVHATDTSPAVYGFSAIDFVDKRDASRPPPRLSFTGFRLIRE